MKGLTLTTKEQARLQALNGVLEQCWSVPEAAEVLGLSERYVWRILAAYRKEFERAAKTASSPHMRHDQHYHVMVFRHAAREHGDCSRELETAVLSGLSSQGLCPMSMPKFALLGQLAVLPKKSLQETPNDAE